MDIAEGRRETEVEFIAKWWAWAPFTICNWFGQGFTVHKKSVWINVVQYVYEPVYKPVVQQIQFIDMLFLQINLT